MSGTRQINFTLSGQSTDWSNPDAARIYIERIFEPVFKRVRNTLNQLARDVLITSVSQLVEAKYGLVLVDSSGGAVTLTLVHPVDNFHPITVVKTDSSANAVTIRSFGGELISGASTDTISSYWGFAQYESDATRYVKTTGGNLVGDVTGAPGANTVSFLQTTKLTMGTPTTGQVLMYDGTQVTPIGLNPRVLDTTYSPVGLWNFHLGAIVGAKDYSGNGRDLTLESGTARYSHIAPALGGLVLDGSSNYYFPTPTADFQIIGDMTVLALVVMNDLPPAGPAQPNYLASCSVAPGGTSATNHPFDFGWTIAGGGQWFSKHGANITDGYAIDSFAARSVLSLVGATRTSNSIQFWNNGRALGAPGVLTAPDGGGSALLRIGANSTASTQVRAVVASVGLYNTAFSAAQMVERYNYCLGRSGGFIT